MKRLLHALLLAALSLGSSLAFAQDKPLLSKLTFRVNNQTITCTGNAQVALTAIFDRAMNTAVFPQVNFGQQTPFSFELPMFNREWVNNTTFFATFDVNEDVPPAADGLYKFLMYSAVAASGDTMIATLSDTVVNSQGTPATLQIRRRGSDLTAPDTLDFGRVWVGQSSDSTIYLESVGCAQVRITGYRVRSPFGVINQINGAEIAPGQQLAVRVRFLSQARRVYADSLVIFYNKNEQNSDSSVVKLLGASYGPKIVVWPADSVNFGQVAIGDSVSRTVSVYNEPVKDNSLNDTLRVNNLTTSSSDIFDIFPLEQGGLIVAPGDTQSFSISFTPANNVAYNGRLTLTTNDWARENRQYILRLFGNGLRQQPPPPVDSLIVSWPGGRAGFTNSDTLTICLSADLSNVLQARWKFTQNDNAPPTSAADTTGSGRFFVQDGRVCFRIPLRGVIGSGRWACYVWLEGRNGVSGYTTALRTYLTYDNTPPVFVSLPTVFSGGWTGGFPGFSNADSIRLCWTQTNDPSGLSEVRWKFTTLREPPRTATDYGQGGFFKQNNATCVTLPLRGRLTAGRRWYCYVWFVDGAGNSNFQDAARTETIINYDLTAPAKPIAPATRSIPAHIWFGASRFLTLTFNLPPNQSDAARAFWRFGRPPAAAGQSDGQAELTRATNGSRSLAIFFNSPSLCGDDSLYFWFADSAGNVNFNNYSLVRYRFDMCPPTVSRLRPNANLSAKIGVAFSDTLVLTDAHSGIANSRVIYRFGGAQVAEPPRLLTRIGQTNQYFLVIPSAGVTRRGVEYRVVVKDSVDNEQLGLSGSSPCASDSGWISISARVEGEGDYRVDSDGGAVPLLAGDNRSNYQLFSIPYQLDNSKSAVNVLQQALGDYDNKYWRLFDYLPQNGASNRWLEGSNARAFAPGRAFFVVTRKNDIVVKSGAAQTRRTLCPDTIRVYDGWNLIATPFNFPVHKEALSLLNSGSIISLRSFENGWNISDVMEPWRGYALYVVRSESVPANTPIYLVIQPKAAPGRIGKASMLLPALNGNEWRMQIAAEAGQVHDRNNWAGVNAGASDAFDNLEIAEPPVIGDYVRVAFPHQEWQQPAELFSTDWRASGNDDQVWTFEVNTNLSKEAVHLKFEMQGNMPESNRILLIDEAAGLVQDLRNNAEYVFLTGAEGAQKQLKLAVGSESFAKEQAGALALTPADFALLQNYPNPFNPATSLRFNLPHAGAVSLVIYNPLGQRVRTLLDNASYPTGYHSTLWDGRDDHGVPVASGIYIYRLQAGGETLTRKMILQK